MYKLYVKEREMHMFSACSICIINASLWKTLLATTFVLANARFCLHIQERFFAYDNVQILKN